MRQGKVRCQVVETGAGKRNSSAGVRDLLPSADPYIATLVAQLSANERRDRAGLNDTRFQIADADWHDDDSALYEELDPDGSHLDFPPVIGGWPLLSDVPESKLGS